MRKATFLLFFFCFINFCWGQVSVSPGDTSKTYIHSLVRTLVGKGVEVYNIKYKGSPLAIGTFSDPKDSIGLSNGIILTTGNLKIAEGPNEAEVVLTTDLGQPGSEFLRRIAGSQDSRDAAVIEFDVVPLKDNFSFRFVFGSEEYNKQSSTSDEVSGILGDVFAILVTGPGLPTAGKNIAVVPVVDDFISAKNINNGRANFGVKPTGPCENCSYFKYNSPGSTITGYNSYTTVFTASTPVHSCQTYHVAIGIADISDDPYGDSGVFIEAGSFGGEGIVSTIPLSDNGIAEICSDQPYPVFSVTGTTTGIAYQWYINDTLTSFTNNAISSSKTGEYKVKGTMPGTVGGCAFSDSLLFSIGEIFTLKSTNTTRLCTQDSIVIITNPDKPGSYSYKWKPASDFYYDTLPGQKVKPSIATTYKVEVKNKGGCLVKDTVKVIVNPLIFGTISIQDTIDACQGNVITLSSKFTITQAPLVTGSDSFQIKWYDPEGKFRGSGNKLKGIASVTGTYTDSLISNNGCILKDSLYLKTEKIMIKVPDDTSICIGNTVIIAVSGGIAYQWTSSDILFNESTTTGFIAKPVASSSYFVTGYGAMPLFCQSSDTINLIVYPLPAIVKSPDTTICKGTDIKIHANGAVITWDEVILFPSDSILAPDVNSVYRFKATNNYLCSISDSIRITVLPLPQTTITGKTKACRGENTQFTIAGADFYNWYTKDHLLISTLSSPLIFPIQSDYYFVESALSTGCQSKDSVFVKVNNISLTGFIKVKGGAVCPVREIKDTLSGPPGYFYKWEPGNIANAYIEVSDSGFYSLVIKDVNFCSAIDSVFIKGYCAKDTILPDSSTNTYDRMLFIPNVITPNEDRINDTFVIRGLKTNATFVVYNRWGSVVFESADYKDEWNAEGLPDGLYYYVVSTTGNSKTYKGWVEVFR